HSNSTNPRNYVRIPCTKCNEEGITLLTINEKFVNKKCPTCSGVKQVPVDPFGKYSTQYSTILIRREDDFFLVKYAEIDIYVGDKLVGILKQDDLEIKIRKGLHEIQARNPYSWHKGHSRKIEFSTKDRNHPLEFLCTADLEGLSYL